MTDEELRKDSGYVLGRIIEVNTNNYKYLYTVLWDERWVETEWADWELKVIQEPNTILKEIL